MSKNILTNIKETPQKLWAYLLFSIIIDTLQATILFTAVMCLVPSITGVGAAVSFFCGIASVIGLFGINLIGGIIMLLANQKLLKGKGKANWIVTLTPPAEFVLGFIPPLYPLIGLPVYVLWTLYNIVLVDKREFK